MRLLLRTTKKDVHQIKTLVLVSGVVAYLKQIHYSPVSAARVDATAESMPPETPTTKQFMPDDLI